jgi:hypothetical protein
VLRGLLGCPGLLLLGCSGVRHGAGLVNNVWQQKVVSFQKQTLVPER